MRNTDHVQWHSLPETMSPLNVRSSSNTVQSSFFHPSSLNSFGGWEAGRLGVSYGIVCRDAVLCCCDAVMQWLSDVRTV